MYTSCDPSYPETKSRNLFRSGFTLIEMIIVVILITLIVSITAPRLTSTKKKQFEQTVSEISDLMLLYAHREMTSRYPVGIKHDLSRNELLVQVYRPDEESDEENPPPRWQSDPLSPSVQLPGFIDKASGVLFLEQGEAIDITERPVMSTPGQTRLHLQVDIESVDGYVAQLVLLPHSMAPLRIKDDFDIEYMDNLQIVDLNAQQRDREDW